jgi:hypothetical protein
LRRPLLIAAGLALALSATALWHGPLGAADRLATKVEGRVGAELERLEMTGVAARLDRAPTTRRIVLSGQADAFQRSELVRRIAAVPGVSSAQWNAPGGIALPLLAEAGLMAALAYFAGLLLSYLVELRRRARADWRWL